MGIILGPITHVVIDGQDVTDCIASVSFTGIDASADPPPACNWDTVVEAYNRIARDAPAEAGPTHPRVIDQDGNPVHPPARWPHTLGGN